MKTFQLHSIAVKDKKVVLELPIDLPDSKVDLVLVLNPANGQTAAHETEDWIAFVDRTEGRIDDPSFREHPKGAFRPIVDFDP